MNVHVPGASNNPYAGLKLSTLQSRLELAKTDVETAKATVELIESEIASRVAESVEVARKLANKETGVIHVVVEGCDVKHDQPKSIAWDSKALMGACSRMQGAGVDPYEHVEIKLSVTEKKYEKLPPELRKWILPARTEKRGSPKITITPVEAN